MNNEYLKLTLITNKSNYSINQYCELISTCIKFGLTSVQLREKQLYGNNLIKFGRSLKKLLDIYKVCLIVNDNLDLCLELDAHGLHLGQDDGDIVYARKRLGPNKIIGLTINTTNQLEQANHLPINYIGIGTIFPTQSKANVQTTWGLSGLHQATSCSMHPVIAIGGINENNAGQVMQAGASGIAAIGAFHNTSNPEATTQRLKSIVDGVFKP